MRSKAYIPSEQKYGIFPCKEYNYINEQPINGVDKNFTYGHDSYKIKSKGTACDYFLTSGNLMIKNNHSYVLYESANNTHRNYHNPNFQPNSNAVEELQTYVRESTPANEKSYEPVLNRNKKTIYKDKIAKHINNKKITVSEGVGYKMNFNEKNKTQFCEKIRQGDINIFQNLESKSSQEDEQTLKEKIFMSNLDILLSYENIRLSNKILIELLSPIPEIRKIEDKESNKDDTLRIYREFLFKSDMGLELKKNDKSNIIYSANNLGNNKK